MGIGEFLRWIKTARVDERCEAGRSIARTSLDPELDLEERCTAEAALTLMLDDPSPRVRRAIADVLSLSNRSPAPVLHALALEHFDVAAPIVARSALDDDTLSECLTRGDERIAKLIADRPRVSARVCEALIERGGVEACLILITNPRAALAEHHFARMIARHGSHAEMRGALMGDGRLSLALRQQLVEVTSRAVCGSPLVKALLGSERAERIAQEASADAPIAMVEYVEIEELKPYVRSLRDAGRLTSALTLKALVYGRVDFVATILDDLTGRGEERVRSILVRGGQNSLRALLSEAGLRNLMLDLALKALTTWRDVAAGRATVGRQELAWQLMKDAQAREGSNQNDDLTAFMRKLYLEIARANAAEHAQALIAEAETEEQIAQIAAEAIVHEIAEHAVEFLSDADLADIEMIDVATVEDVPEEIPSNAMLIRRLDDTPGFDDFDASLADVLDHQFDEAFEDILSQTVPGKRQRAA